MPRGPKGEKRPADVIKLRHYRQSPLVAFAPQYR
jgi:hypothetical protein